MIVAFGEALIDLFAVPRGSPLDEATHFVPHVGGALANVALGCALLGAPARFVGSVGSDAHGDRVLRVLSAAGVDVRCVARVPERTAITFVRVADDGARSFLFYRTRTADHAMSPTLVASMSPAILEGASVLVTGTSALVAEPLGSAVRDVVADARRQGVPRVVDLNVRAHLWNDRDAMIAAVRTICRGASVLKASEEDLIALGLAPTLEALSTLEVNAVPVLTLAERGALGRIAGEVLTASAPTLSSDEVVDATGAGDAFVAAMLVALTQSGGLDASAASRDRWVHALAAGCAYGSRAVTAMGATTALGART